MLIKKIKPFVFIFFASAVNFLLPLIRDRISWVYAPIIWAVTLVSLIIQYRWFKRNKEKKYYISFMVLGVVSLLVLCQILYKYLGPDYSGDGMDWTSIQLFYMPTTVLWPEILYISQKDYCITAKILLEILYFIFYLVFAIVILNLSF